MTAMQLYCLLKLDALQTVFGVLCALSVLSIIIMGGVWSTMNDWGNGEPARRVFYRNVKWIAPVGFLFAMLATFMPSTKEMAAIVVVPKIINAVSADKELMSLPGDIVSLASAWVKELRPENIKDGAKKRK